MRSTRQLSITLPNEMAEMVRVKVASGEYASESEVIRDGLRILMARNRALEAWLRDEAVAAHQARARDADRPATAAMETGAAARETERPARSEHGVGAPNFEFARVQVDLKSAAE